MVRLILFISLFFTFSIAFSQERNNWKSFPTTDTNKSTAGEGILSDTLKSNPISTTDTLSGSFNFEVPEDVQNLNKLYTDQSKNNPQIKGYTILLYSGSGANSKLKARNILLQFNEKFSESAAHLAWKSPNYEVRVGDFRTKLEAEKLLQDVKLEFPTAFVKKSMIELPVLRKEEKVDE
jgi:hypothetical protein